MSKCVFACSAPLRRRSLPLIPAIAIVVCAGAFPKAAAAAPPLSTIRGILEVLVVESRVPWADAEVSLADSSSGAVFHAITSTDGSFEFSEVPFGTYELSVETPDGPRQSTFVLVNAQTPAINGVQANSRMDCASAFRLAVKDIESRNTERTRSAARLLRDAIATAGATGSCAASMVRIYGMRFEQYLPHYYLGAALVQLREWCGANIEMANAARELPNSSRLAALRRRIAMELGQTQCPRAATWDQADTIASERTSDGSPDRPGFEVSELSDIAPTTQVADVSPVVIGP